MLVNTHLPRVTGDVRSGLAVVTRNDLARKPLARVLFGAERDAAELAALDVRDAVVPGQPLVDEV